MNSPVQVVAHCGLSNEAMAGTGHKGYFCRMALAGFLLCSALVWLIQQLDFEFALAHGLTVPDSVNMTQTLQHLWRQDRILTPDSGFQAVAAIYGWTWLLHPSLCFAVNCVLMLSNAALFKKIVLVRLRVAVADKCWRLPPTLGSRYGTLHLVHDQPVSFHPASLLHAHAAHCLRRDGGTASPSALWQRHLGPGPCPDGDIGTRDSRSIPSHSHT